MKSLSFPLRLREELPVAGLHSQVGFLAELHVQPVPLGQLPSWTELLAVFHIWMGPLSGSGITPVWAQAVLPNLDGTLAGLYIKAGPQAGLYGWVDQGAEKAMAPTPILLPGKSHGQRSLVGCSPWGHEELDTTERLHFHFSLSRIGERNGNPLQCSCLENPRGGEAWWAAIYGVTQSQTRLKRLSSSSRSGKVLTVGRGCRVDFLVRRGC